MTDDIVTGLREQANDPEKTLLDAYALDAANEIERLRKLCDQLAEALEIQVQTNRVPASYRAHYSQHAIDALKAMGIEVSNYAPSEKQLWLFKKLLKDAGKLPPLNIDQMDKFEVSRGIEALKNNQEPDLPPMPDEEPF